MFIFRICCGFVLLYVASSQFQRSMVITSVMCMQTKKIGPSAC